MKTRSQTLRGGVQLLALLALSSVFGAANADTCLQPRFSVSPSSPHPNEQITLTISDSNCETFTQIDQSDVKVNANNFEIDASLTSGEVRIMLQYMIAKNIGTLPVGHYSVVYVVQNRVLDRSPYGPPETFGPWAFDVTSAGTVSVVEYYNAEMDHYFMTSVPIEVAICNTGQAPCAGWIPTGESFEAWAPGAADPPNDTPMTKICRLYNDTFVGKSTHFYGTFSDCEQTLTLFSDWKQETSELFDAAYPEGFAPGTCTSLYRPVFRLYNNGMGGAPNHRFTTDGAIVQQMIAKGWTQEGEGSGLAVFCVPNVN